MTASNGRFLEQAYDAVFLIYKAPRTIDDLCEVIGCTKETSRRYVRAAIAIGLVAQVGERKNLAGPRTRIYGRAEL